MTSEITLTPGPVRAVSMRLLMPYVGVWLADLELDPTTATPAPTSGEVTIAIASSPPVTLAGTIDPRGSGSFAERVTLRVLGGGGGWDRPVTRQHFHSDGGVPSVRVYAATALAVGEAVAVSAPQTFAADFVRSMGPASRVFQDEPSWWVDFSGVTQVGPRPSLAPPDDLVLLDWQPSTETAEIATGAPLVPGTTIRDARLPGGGPIVVRDVEQRFDSAGGRALAWCGAAPAAQLLGDLRSLVEEFSGRKFLATYLYRVVAQNSDGRLQLQALRPSAGLPDILPIAPWTGHGGASAKLLPGSLVRVAFVGGDPSQPVADAYEPARVPLESTIDASTALHLGPSSAAVQLAGGGHPLAFADLVLVELGKIATAIGTLGGTYTPPTSPPGSSKVTSG